MTKARVLLVTQLNALTPLPWHFAGDPALCGCLVYPSEPQDMDGYDGESDGGCGFHARCNRVGLAAAIGGGAFSAQESETQESGGKNRRHGQRRCLETERVHHCTRGMVNISNVWGDQGGHGTRSQEPPPWSLMSFCLMLCGRGTCAHAELFSTSCVMEGPQPRHRLMRSTIVLSYSQGMLVSLLVTVDSRCTKVNVDLSTSNPIDEPLLDSTGFVGVRMYIWELIENPV